MPSLENFTSEEMVSIVRFSTPNSVNPYEISRTMINVYGNSCMAR